MEYLQQIFGSCLCLSTEYGVKQGGKGSLPSSVVVFGNVLLDHTINLKDDPNLLDKFQLPEISKAEFDADTLSNLTAEICSHLDCKLNPGGSGLNTVRIFKQLGIHASFVGAVGEDKTAQKLREVLQTQGIDARLQIVPELPTGQCVCLLRPQGESLYANIGASKNFSIDFLKHNEKHEDDKLFISSSKKQIIYIEGFFITHQREKVCEYIIGKYVTKTRHLAINLSAPYIVLENWESLLELSRSALFIFGNEEEFKTFATVTNNENIECLANMLLKSSSSSKVIVITKGAQGVDIISNYVYGNNSAGDVSYQCYNTKIVETVVDTTGAGDSFVAGFLHAWLDNRQLSECARMAMDVAAKVVTQIGANLPQN